MNYELALELQDAGWGRGKDDYCPPSLGCCEITLEELIEECGEGFETLSRDTSTSTTCWVVNTFGEIDAPEETVLGWFEGKTPTEAVARLWLELNKKT